MKKFRLLIFHLLLLLAAYAFCRLIVGARRRAASAPTSVRCDTLIIRDTLRVSRPVPVREEVVRYVTVRVRDSSNLTNIGKDSAAAPPASAAPTAAPTAADHFPDTAKKVTLPITQQVYRDSSYTAWVSGYAAALDSIEVYPRTLIVRQPAAKPRRWCFGLQAGYGLTPKGVQPYVGLGLTFRLP